MPKSYRYVVLTGIFSLSLAGCNLPFLGGNQLAALNVTSTPKATLFLDEEQLGTTPFYDEKIKSGDYSIKLVTEDSQEIPWEARVKLSPGILTVISRELGDSYERSSGYVLSLEPITDKGSTTSVLIVTVPDGSLVSVDGESKGFAPAMVDNLPAGDHVVIVSSPGYIEKSIKTKVVEGHKLTASVQLAKAIETQTPKADSKTDESAKEDEPLEVEEEALDADIDLKKASKSSPKPSASPVEDSNTVGADLKPPYVTILDTPTGWLNVRKTPSTYGDNIIQKVNPGDQFKYLDKNDIGWYQIELDAKTKGWISSKYAKLTEK